MMKPIILKIIKQIIKSHQEQSVSSLTKTKLVKILYLVEVEFFKLRQKRLTDLKWEFYHYGPYAHEIETVLGSPDIEEISFITKGGKTGFKYAMPDNNSENHTPFEIKSIVDQTVKEWGDADLNQLLDYVYFETAPMKTAKRGDTLDFSAIKPWEPTQKIRVIRINPKKLKELHNKYLPHVREKAKLRPVFHATDPKLTECLKIWDEEISPLSIKGQVIFGMEDDNSYK